MSLLIPASHSDQLAARIGIYGGAGGGKTLTATLLAIGLSKTYHASAPICIVDGESAAGFVRDICDLEGVPLVRVPSHTFIDMRQGLTEAEESCCAFIVDHYDGSNRELVEAYRERLGLQGRRLQFQHRDELLAVWGEWTRAMRSSPLNIILNGRLAWEWEDVEDAAGDLQSVKTNTKMRGESNYEPDLLIELEAIRDTIQRDKRTRSRRGSFIHSAVILKDRHRTLNGRSWQWKDLNDYKVGAWASVFKAFQPHFDKLGLAARGPRLVRRESLARSSAALFTPATGESKFAEAARRRTIALEKIDSALAMIWPGQTGDEKRLRHIVLQSVFKTRSRTEIDGKDPLTLESAVQLVEAFESILPSEKARDEAEVIATIESVRNDLREKSEAF